MIRFSSMHRAGQILAVTTCDDREEGAMTKAAVLVALCAAAGTLGSAVAIEAPGSSPRRDLEEECGGIARNAGSGWLRGSRHHPS